MSVVIDGKECYGIIYKIENTITHKIYIGQTTHPKGFNGRYYYKGKGIERVYRDLKSKQSRGERCNQYLLRSIEKCGFDAFIVNEMLDTAVTIDELNEKESYYIKKYDSYKNGYNMSFGGDSMSGYERPKGKDCKNSKRVCQISLDGELIKVWASAADAHNELGVCQSSISQICSGYVSPNGKRKMTAGGFVWVLEKDYDPCKDYSINRQRQNMGRGSKAVLLLSNDGDVLNEFHSINEAARELGIAVESIRKICQHKIKNPRYKLIYKSEYIEEQRLSVRGLYEVS